MSQPTSPVGGVERVIESEPSSAHEHGRHVERGSEFEEEESEQRLYSAAEQEHQSYQEAEDVDEPPFELRHELDDDVEELDPPTQYPRHPGLVTVEDGPLHSRQSSLAAPPNPRPTPSFTIEEGSIHSRSSSIAQFKPPVSPSPLASAIAASPALEKSPLSALAEQRGGLETASPMRLPSPSGRGSDPSRPSTASAPPAEAPATAASQPRQQAPRIIPTGLDAVEASVRVAATRQTEEEEEEEEENASASPFDRSRSRTPSPDSARRRSISSESSDGQPLLPSPSPDSRLRAEQELRAIPRYAAPHTHDFASTQSYADTLALGAAGPNTSSAKKYTLKAASRAAVTDEESGADEFDQTYAELETPSRQPGMSHPGHRGTRRYETNASLALSEDSFSPSPTPSPLGFRPGASGLIQGALLSSGLSASGSSQSWQQVAMVSSGASRATPGGMGEMTIHPTYASSGSLAQQSSAARSQQLRSNLANTSVSNSIADRLVELLIEKENEVYSQAAQMRALALQNAQRNHEVIELIYRLERNKAEYNQMLADIKSISAQALDHMPDRVADRISPNSPLRRTPFELADVAQIRSDEGLKEYARALPSPEQRIVPARSPQPQKGEEEIYQQRRQEQHREELEREREPQQQPRYRQEREERKSPQRHPPPQREEPQPEREYAEAPRPDRPGRPGSNVSSPRAASGSGLFGASRTPVPKLNVPQPTSAGVASGSGAGTGAGAGYERGTLSPGGSRRDSSTSSSPFRGGSATGSSTARSSPPRDLPYSSGEASALPSRIHSARELGAGERHQLGSVLFGSASPPGPSSRSAMAKPPVVPALNIPVVSLPVSAPTTSRDGAPEEPPKQKRGEPQKPTMTGGEQRSAQQQQQQLRAPSKLSHSDSSVLEIWDTLEDEDRNPSLLGHDSTDGEQSELSDEEDQPSPEVEDRDASPSSITDDFIRAENERQRSISDAQRGSDSDRERHVGLQPDGPALRLQEYVQRQWEAFTSSGEPGPSPALASAGSSVHSTGTLSSASSRTRASTSSQQPRSPRVTRVEDSFGATPQRRESPTSPTAPPKWLGPSSTAAGNLESRESAGRSAQPMKTSAASGQVSEEVATRGPASSALAASGRMRTVEIVESSHVSTTTLSVNDGERERASTETTKSSYKHTRVEAPNVAEERGAPIPSKESYRQASEESQARAAASSSPAARPTGHEADSYAKKQQQVRDAIARQQVYAPTKQQSEEVHLSQYSHPSSSEAQRSDQPQPSDSSRSSLRNKQAHVASAIQRQAVWSPERDFAHVQGGPGHSAKQRHEEAHARQHVWAPESQHAPYVQARARLDKTTQDLQAAMKREREEEERPKGRRGEPSESEREIETEESAYSSAAETKQDRLHPKAGEGGFQSFSERQQLLAALAKSQADALRYKELVIRLKQDRVKLKTKVATLKSRLAAATSIQKQYGNSSPNGSSSAVSSAPSSAAKEHAKQQQPPQHYQSLQRDQEQQALLMRLIATQEELKLKFKKEKAHRKELEAEVRRLIGDRTSAASVAPASAAVSSSVAAPPKPDEAESKQATKRYPTAQEREAQLRQYQQQQQSQQRSLPQGNDSPLSTWELLDADAEFGDGVDVDPTSACVSRGRPRSRPRSPLVHILPNEDVYAEPSEPRKTSPELLRHLGQAHAASHLHMDAFVQQHQPPRGGYLPTGRSSSVVAANPSKRSRSVSAVRDGLNPAWLMDHEQLEQEQQQQQADYEQREAERQQKLQEKRARLRSQSSERAVPQQRQGQLSQIPQPASVAARRSTVAPRSITPPSASVYDERKEYDSPHRSQLQNTLNSEIEGFDRIAAAAKRSHAPAPSQSHRLPRSNWRVESEVAWQQRRAEFARQDADDRQNGFIREFHASPTRHTHRFIREERRELERKRLGL